MGGPPHDFCPMCGAGAWSQAPDGRGNTIVGYTCTAEYIFDPEGKAVCAGNVRVGKECPDWGGAKQADKLKREHRGR